MVLFLNKKKLQPKKAMLFKVGEGLTPEQTQRAEEVVRQPVVNNTYQPSFTIGDIFFKKPKMVFPIGEGMSKEEAEKARAVVTQEDLAVRGYREGSFFTRPTAGFYDPMAHGYLKDIEFAQQTFFSPKSTREEKIEAFDFLMQPVISASQPLEPTSGKIPTATPKGEIKPSVLKIFAKDKNPLSIERSLKQIGLDDINAKSLSFDLAKANTADEVSDALVAFSNKPLSIASKGVADDVASGVAKQATSISDDLAKLKQQTIEPQIAETNLIKEAEILRGTKGMTADDIMATYPNIKLKRDIPATTIDGVKTTIKEGEKLTPYELKGNKILLQDGKTYIVSKNQFQNIKGQSVLAEGKPFAPELEGLEESIKSAETKKKIPEGYGEKPLEQYKAELKRQMPKYENYTLPGGENYKEILIKAPDTRKTVGVEKIESIYDLQDYFSKKMFNEDKLYKLSSYQKQQVFDNPEYSKLHDKLKENKVVNIRVDITDEGIKSQEGAFKSSHWDEPNVISHIRMNERTYNGKKVAFMEELQSDWAKEGRDKGFSKNLPKGTENDIEIKFVKSNVPEGHDPKNYSGYYEAFDKRTGDFLGRGGTKPDLMERALEEINLTKGVPYNPLLKNWQELSIKRALKDAVDNNSDYFAWINGEQTSARYNLSKEIESIKWGKSTRGDLIGNISVTIEPKTAHVIGFAFDKTGKIIESFENAQSWKGKQLEDVVGKGIAEKIMASPEGKLEGEGLNMGGEWASNLYDRQVKNIVEKLTDQKVEMLDLGLPIDNKVPAFDLIQPSGKRISKLTPDNLEVGAPVSNAKGDYYVITDVLGEGKFKAVPKQSLDKLLNDTGYGARKMENKLSAIRILNIEEPTKLDSLKQTFDISQKTTQQQAIKLTPEVKNKIKGIAPKIKTSGKMFEEKPQTKTVNEVKEVLGSYKPVSQRIPLGEIIKKESNIEDVIFQEAKKYKSAEEFVKAQGKGLPSSWFDYRSKIPNVKGGWTKDKIVKHLKNVGSDYKQTTFNKEILKFDNPQELEQNLFYHGSGRSIGSLKPSITMTERQAEMFGGGGYGERYWGISLSKDRNMASAFTGQARSGEVAPVILKKGAKVKSMPEIQDAVELEDHIVRLWDEGVDAVKIGDWKSEFSEQELVVLNPKAIVVGKGDYFPVYQKPKMPSFDEKKINEMFQEALPNWKKLREEERRIFVDNFKAKYGREPAPNNANDIILDEYFKTKSQLEDIWKKAQTIQNISETTTKKILTSAKETPIEFGLGKGVIQEKIISNEASKLNDLLNRAKITKEESLELFNAFDNPQKYKLSQSLINKNGDDIIKEGRRLNSFLSEQKLSRGVIDRVYDDETYLRTVLETLDGKKPTAEQVARLRNATNQTFRDQLARDLTGFSGKLREKIKTDIRKYRTADERDAILESFGLRTKRDFVNSMSENIRLTTRATSNKEFNDAVRSIAKDGFWVKGKKLVKRDDIIEAYDPFVVSKTRQEIKNNTSKKISKIIDEIKEERMLTENEAKIIKDIIYEQKEEAIKELKDSHKYALDDIDNIINFTKQQIARVKNTLLDEKAILLERKTKLIENIRDEAKKELNDFYGKITIKRGELIDKGFKDAGSISGAEPLRGVMLNKKDYRALKEFVEELGESSLEDFAKTIKYFQATLDLFQIPQLLRSSISSSGFIKGCWDWLKAVVKSSGVSVDDMVKSSEFVQQGRFKDFDIDIWNKQLKDMNDNTSWFMKQFKKLGKKTDNIPVVRGVLNGIGAIDEYQFQTVMIPLKTKAWLRKVDGLKRLYPNLDERSIMVEAGRFIDDYFGGQQWDKLMARNPRLASRQNQRISRIMIFATDYLTSTMRKLKRETFDAFTKWGVPEGNMARKALAREIIFGLGLVNAISYMTRGKSAFENDDPNQFYKIQTNIKDGGGNPYYLDIMGNWGQTWNLINRPIDAIRGKISGIGKIGVSLLADGELKIGEALNPIPFSWRSILETAYNHALGRKPGTQIPETIGGGALITLMEFMGLAGTFSGGKSRRQTLMRMIEAESFTPEEVWKYLTGQNVFTNKERITRMIEKDGISDAYSWELEQKKKGYLSEESYPTRDALKTKYEITGSITNDENILRINRMTKEEQRIFIEGYSEKTQELIKDKIKTGSYKKSLSDIFK